MRLLIEGEPPSGRESGASNGDPAPGAPAAPRLPAPGATPAEAPDAADRPRLEGTASAARAQDLKTENR